MQSVRAAQLLLALAAIVIVDIDEAGRNIISEVGGAKLGRAQTRLLTLSKNKNKMKNKIGAPLALSEHLEGSSGSELSAVPTGHQAQEQADEEVAGDPQRSMDADGSAKTQQSRRKFSWPWQEGGSWLPWQMKETADQKAAREAAEAQWAAEAKWKADWERKQEYQKRVLGQVWKVKQMPSWAAVKNNIGDLMLDKNSLTKKVIWEIGQHATTNWLVEKLPGVAKKLNVKEKGVDEEAPEILVNAVQDIVHKRFQHAFYKDEGDRKLLMAHAAGGASALLITSFVMRWWFLRIISDLVFWLPAVKGVWVALDNVTPEDKNQELPDDSKQKKKNFPKFLLTSEHRRLVIWRRMITGFNLIVLVLTAISVATSGLAWVRALPDYYDRMLMWVDPAIMERMDHPISVIGAGISSARQWASGYDLTQQNDPLRVLILWIALLYNVVMTFLPLPLASADPDTPASALAPAPTFEEDGEDANADADADAVGGRAGGGSTSRLSSSSSSSSASGSTSGSRATAARLAQAARYDEVGGLWGTRFVASKTRLSEKNIGHWGAFLDSFLRVLSGQTIIKHYFHRGPTGKINWNVFIVSELLAMLYAFVMAAYHVMFDTQGWYSKNIEALGLVFEDEHEGPGYAFWAGLGNGVKGGAVSSLKAIKGAGEKSVAGIQLLGANMKTQLGKVQMPKPQLKLNWPPRRAF